MIVNQPRPVYVYLYTHRDCLRLAFMHIIRRELHQVASEWNNHPIRPSKTALAPAGTPEELFFMPILSGNTHTHNVRTSNWPKFNLISIAGTHDYIHPVDSGDLVLARQHTIAPEPPGSLEFLLATQHLMQENELTLPATVEEALEFYITIKSLIEEQLQS